MARFTDSLSEKSKESWPEIYQRLTGRKWCAPEKDKRAIHLEVKIEDTAEIAKIMEERPNYVVDVQGREG
jgi:hypothetical protein